LEFTLHINANKISTRMKSMNPKFAMKKAAGTLLTGSAICPDHLMAKNREIE
jgi:hypothetical protein